MPRSGNKNSSLSEFMKKYAEEAVADSLSPNVPSSPFSSYKVTGITSRDEIINPYQILHESYSFDNDAEGQAKYNETLNALLAIQAQQQASYDEWYNSAEQQALREVEANRNPALSDISAGEVASTNSPSDSPLANIPTQDEIVTQRISAVSSIFSALLGGATSIASAATSFADLPLKAVNLKNLGIQGDILSLTKDAQSLSNATNLSSSIAGMIGDLFATAKQAHLDSGSSVPFNVDSWFNNDANFSPIKDVLGHQPGFVAALAQSRKSMLAHQKYANELQRDSAQANWDFGLINSDPRYSSEQKLMISQLMPFMQRMIEADDAENKLRKVIAEYESAYNGLLSPESAAAAVNEQNSYNSAYYSSLDGKLVAAFEDYMRSVETSGKSMQKAIHDNLLSMYKGHENDIQGWRAAFLFGSNYGSSWEDVYYSNQSDKFISLIESNDTIKKSIANNAELAEKIRALAPIISGLSTDSSEWQNNNLGWRLWKSNVSKYINAITSLNLE